MDKLCKVYLNSSIFIFTVLLSACRISSNTILPSPNGTPTKPISISNSLSSTSPTQEATIAATSLTPSKLSPEEAHRAMTELVENNGGCNFPCYLGVSPGKTTLQELYDIFSPLGEMRDTGDSSTSPETIPILVCVPYCMSSQPFVGHFPVFWTRNGVVTGISPDKTFVDDNFRTSIAGVFTSFGDPEEIWIRLVRDVLNNKVSYELRLVYQSQGIIVGLSGETQDNSDGVQICPQTYNNVPYSIFLYDNSERIQFYEFEAEFLGDLIGWNSEEYVLLDDVAINFTSTDFINTYRLPNATTCFAVEVKK